MLIAVLVVLFGLLLLLPLVGILHAHVAYATHGGGGGEEEVNTANYGRYTVPMGPGEYLLGLLAVASTPAIGSYVRLSAREWDGEEVLSVIQDTELVDPSDYQWLSKPRFCKGGSVIYFYATHNANQAVHIVAVFRTPGPMQTPGGYKGESKLVVPDNVGNSAANAWTTVKSYKMPAEKGPFLITGASIGNSGMIAGRIIAPNQPNSVRPLIQAFRAPVAGINGPLVGKLIEPIEVPANETISLEALSTAAEAAYSYLEIIPAGIRTGVPPGAASEPSVTPPVARLTAGSIAAMALMR